MLWLAKPEEIMRKRMTQTKGTICAKVQRKKKIGKPEELKDL